MTTKPVSSTTPPRTHWSDAAHHWRHYGPPLRPCVDDVRTVEELVRCAHAAAHGRPLRALLLGVTPEIARMAWPRDTMLLAVDRSPAMIEHVWPGDVAGQRQAVCADWFDFLRGTERFDVIVGDGNFSILDFPGQCRELAAAVQRALTRNGTLIVRYFVQTVPREMPAAVFADLAANRIGSFDTFKLRLAMAMQESAEGGVRMGDVFDAWVRAGVDRRALQAKTGWSFESIDTILPWEGKDARLSFPSGAEMASLLGECLEPQDERRLGYELGDRCPIASYRTPSREVDRR